MDFIIGIIIAFITFWIYEFGLCNIFGSIACGIKRLRRGKILITPIIVWLIILGGVTAIALLCLDDYIVYFIIAVILAFIVALYSIPNLVNEQIENNEKINELFTSNETNLQYCDSDDEVNCFDSGIEEVTKYDSMQENNLENEYEIEQSEPFATKKPNKLTSLFYKLVILFHGHGFIILCSALIILTIILLFLLPAISKSADKKEYIFNLGSKFSVSVTTYSTLENTKSNMEDFVSENNLSNYDNYDVYGNNNISIFMSYLPKDYIGIKRMNELYGKTNIFDTYKAAYKAQEDSSDIFNYSFQNISTELGKGEIYCFTDENYCHVDCCLENEFGIFCFMYLENDKLDDKELVFEVGEEIIKSAKLLNNN